MKTAVKFNLDSLVKAKLPPLPGSVMKISSLLLDYNVSQHKIAEAAGCDPMLASRILRLVNSPIYPFEHKITSLTEAVTVLGNKAIYEMVMIGAIADSFTREIRYSAVGRDIWLHSLATAIAARELCILYKMNGLDEAFTCGLLHDIGKLLIFRADSTLYAEVYYNVEAHENLPVEREALGFDHTQVGALAARRWHLPEPLCNMILYHHDPTLASQGILMTHIINIADSLAYLKNYKLDYEEDFMMSSSMLTLGFTTGQLDAVWDKVVENLREIVKAFYK